MPLKAPLKKVNDDRKKLRSSLVDVDDDRARSAYALLGKTAPDLDALSALVTGGEHDSPGPAEVCARILAVTLPAEADVEAAAAELEGAQAALADLGERRSRAAELRDQLLAEALEYHAAAGETPCPVCEVGVLDAAWQTRTTAALQQTDLLRQAHQEAESRLQRAELAARRLLNPAPAVLGQTDVDLPSQAAAAEAWRRWSLPASPDPEHLRGQLPLLTAAVDDWQSEARDHAESIAERWAPFALRLAALVTDYRKALALDHQGRQLDDAYAAATRCVDTLREERLRPIVDQTLQIWSQLKQESNVSLEAIALTSRNTRRGVDIRAVVDDASGANALSVMSQGELNSLALAMYLPRATSDESPFRFLVLDDPVQAMDPTKVEGLAAVLADLARTRQVIVFSHDDRLAHAARRLPGGADDPERPARPSLPGHRPERDAARAEAARRRVRDRARGRDGRQRQASGPPRGPARSDRGGSLATPVRRAAEGRRSAGGSRAAVGRGRADARSPRGAPRCVDVDLAGPRPAPDASPRTSATPAPTSR